MALLFQPSATVPLPKLLLRTRSMATTSCSPTMASRKLPILLFDVMDTLVRDPFYEDVPNFFKMSLKEILEEKHPTAWVECEEGLISEMELAKKFFKDGRPFDLEGLKECMVRGYCYINGIEALLQNLKLNNYEMHAFTNYPIWYTLIEEKLKLSKYLSWTFCSCLTGKRKPAPDSYAEVLTRLGVDPANCVFIDDRITNVEAAKNAGMVGLQFKNADTLKEDLSLLGIGLVTQDN
ncbi:Soluble epoxide hydrolase protein [Dioscorea alata]|uniref:Soluble epoxide hydrolase protein n=3 Tax=Dioscorea alata TaxID=55571 RepID=A0ACB7VBP6_DIOAL|nr:Soluble epoxide hydrolase protein [Dioscorea alata]KAH7670960.1 Soluble epoxide hydrolase protein [Dioscorea alata]KAH7670961.1 Soluble epoxide hydrolase protein [Dioscorea alata]